IELQTYLGQKVTIPLSKISSINYATANIKWLSELEVLEAVADKRFSFRSNVSGLDRAMAPRFIANKGPTAIANSGDKDLYFPSPGRFVFRAPEGFSSFQSQVLRTDEGNQRSDLTIEVWQDDQRIAGLPLPFDQDSIEINVSVQAGKKIRLAVAGGSKLMVGTEVQWKQPRLKR
ncbi:MAG: NPCBM/NEW2 domain-containing protein, partial [Pirellula sp.]